MLPPPAPPPMQRPAQCPVHVHVCVHMCSCVHGRATRVRSPPIPGFAPKGGCPSPGPTPQCQGAGAGGREGAGGIPWEVGTRGFLLLLSTQGIPSLPHKGHSPRWWQRGPQISPPADHRAGNSR